MIISYLSYMYIFLSDKFAYLVIIYGEIVTMFSLVRTTLFRDKMAVDD